MSRLILLRTHSVLGMALLLLGASPAAASQPSVLADKPSPAAIDQLGKQIDARRAEIEKDTTLDEAARTGALARLSEGRAFLAQATADIETTGLIAQERAAAPELQAAAEAAARDLPRQPAPEDLASLSASELQIAADEASTAAQSAQASRVAL